MCLILFAYRVRTDAALIVAANRDEFYARPAALAQRWADAPHVLAGRDLTAGGTWLGVSSSGRFAAVTNFSETPEGPLPPGTRGDLTANFLRGDARARDYAAAIDHSNYRGFSLLLWDGADLVYASNRNSPPRVLLPGVHGLANTHLDGDGLWPKVARGTRSLSHVIRGHYTPDDLLKLLADEAVPPDDQLPNRGKDLEFERRVAPIFIRGDEYGTRASSVVTIGASHVQFTEQTFGPRGVPQERVDATLSLTTPARAAG
jgi:uncharacterized protein with NRDE domain